ncbi:MAG: glucose-6-phosphate isomerase [Clostridia bacterium]
MKIKINHELCKDWLNEKDIKNLIPKMTAAHEALHQHNGLGSEYTGWLSLPENHDKMELMRINDCATEIRKKCEVFLVIGIGGSYLGAKTAIDLLESDGIIGAPIVLFIGNTLSATKIKQVLAFIQNKEVIVNVISKSGKTLEPALAFRFIYGFLLEKYGKKEAMKHIVITTDKEKGLLKPFALENNIPTFEVPDDVGGRFSVLTAVGLLPMAVAGINIQDIMDGALEGMNEYAVNDISENNCYRYAALRYLMYKKLQKKIELFAYYEPNLGSFAEWLKQLFGESEGKQLQGLFPASVCNTTDLHSLGQYVQNGERILFETTLWIDKPMNNLKVPTIPDDYDKLNYLTGKDVSWINRMAMQGTVEAHYAGGIPGISLNIEEISAFGIGKMFYFFEKACGIGGYLLEINPFDQPGVEDYKSNMLNLLKR